MFKNRVRTAALAGAIAVATGVSGLTVPAYAQDGTTPQTGNDQNVADGSLAGGGQEQQNAAAVAQVKAADKLKAQAEADKVAIEKHDFFLLSPLKNRPIEASTQAKAEAKEKEATDLLNRSVATLNDIDATLKAVEAETKAAEDAWAAYATATTLHKDERAALAKFARDIEAQPEIIAKIDALHVVNKKPNEVGYIDELTKVGNSTEAQTAFNELVGALAFVMNTDGSEYQIDEAQKAAAVSAQLATYLKGYDNRNALKVDAINKTAIATSRNIAGLRSAFERAQKNVRAARTIQAYYGLGVRWLDLYENDTLRDNETSTLRDTYATFLFGAPNFEAIAVDAHAKVDNDLEWENDAQRVRLIDKKYRTDAATQEAADKAAAVEKKGTSESLASIAESLEKITSNKQAAEGSTDTPGTDTKPAPGKNEGLKGTTIAAIVIGVLAALGGIVAVAFPHIQQFLPKF